MRDNLHIKFNCSDCGKRLNIPTDDERKSAPNDMVQERNPKPLPGAYCNFAIISVQPCQHCIQKEVAPAKKLASALADFMAQLKEST